MSFFKFIRDIGYRRVAQLRVDEQILDGELQKTKHRCGDDFVIQYLISRNNMHRHWAYKANNAPWLRKPRVIEDFYEVVDKSQEETLAAFAQCQLPETLHKFNTLHL